MRGASAVSSRCSVHAAENRLVAKRQDVICRGAHADGFPNVHFRACAKMCVEAQRRVGALEKSRIGSSVGKASLQERLNLRERTIQSARPIKSCPSRTQAKLAVPQRSRPAHDRGKIDRGMKILPSQVHRRISQPAPGCRARSRTGCVHKINWYAQIHAEVLGELVSNIGVQFVDFPSRVRGSTKLHIRSKTGILRRWLSLGKSRCRHKNGDDQNRETEDRTPI